MQNSLSSNRYKWRGPPRKPKPKPSPSAPPRTETTNIPSTTDSIKIILGFKNI